MDPIPCRHIWKQGEFDIKFPDKIFHLTNPLHMPRGNYPDDIWEFFF